MAEINPDVMAQMKRIWSAVNDGTFNKDEINDALRVLHDILSGAAYEAAEASEVGEAAGGVHGGEEGEASEASGEEGGEGGHPHRRKAARKRR